MSCQLHRSIANQLSQPWNEVSFVQPVLEILPKRDLELTACFLQGRKGVSTASTGFTSCPTAYLTLFHILAYAVLTEIVMQWDFWVIQYQKQFGLVVVDAFKRIV